MVRSFAVAATASLILGTVSGAFAEENWEARLDVRSGNAMNRLAFGRHEDATDGRDGRFDVPALLAGDLRASFDGGGDRLWRDIRRSGKAFSRWNLEIVLVEGKAGPVVLTWNPEDFPKGTRVELNDPAQETTVDMTTMNRYETASPGVRRLVIIYRGEEN